MKFVLAKNYMQFRHYYPVRDPKIIYLNRIEQLRGEKNYELEKVGEWYALDNNFIDCVNAEYLLSKGERDER